MQEIKEFQQSTLNQMKYNSDNIKDNVIDFQKKAIQQNPFMSLQYTWQVAQFNKQLIHWITLPLVIQQEYWDTWSNVYNPKGKE